MSSVFKAFFLILLPFCAAAVGASDGGQSPLKGRVAAQVLYVDDGDTLAVLVDGVRHKVRLSDIDAPEVGHCKANPSGCSRPGQPLAAESREALGRLVADARVELACGSYDSRYSRSVCRVYVNDLDVNAVMVQSGMAWFNPKYSRDKQLRLLEQGARQRGDGLWRGPSPVAPWSWRDLCWRQGICR